MFCYNAFSCTLTVLLGRHSYFILVYHPDNSGCQWKTFQALQMTNNKQIQYIWTDKRCSVFPVQVLPASLTDSINRCWVSTRGSGRPSWTPWCGGGCRRRTHSPLSGWSETSGAKLRKNSSMKLEPVEITGRTSFFPPRCPLTAQLISPYSLTELTFPSLCVICASRWLTGRRRLQTVYRERACVDSRSSPESVSCLWSRRR